MIGNLHHVGIAVARLGEAVAKYRSLGFTVGPVETVESEGVRLAFVTEGGTRLELLESIRPDGVIARFIEKRGEGMHHVAFSVPDVRKAIADLRGKGFEVIDDEPRRGHGGRLVAFVHPRSLHGVLLELVQEGARVSKRN
jgi:methylmalonyl-CoA/ethylmalonyl-CoA epimerase